jgi:histone H3
MVTRLAWMAQRFMSSKTPTRYASEASWRAMRAVLWKRASQESGMVAPISFAMSRTNRWSGALASKRSVDFW